MRLFLLPISTRRTLIYCERAPAQPTKAGVKPPLSERIINRTSQTWAQWERAEKGWQKQITLMGNRLFRQIAFEEWGLKSIPPATNKRIQKIESGNLKFECLYPSMFLKEQKVPETLQRLATERQGLHRRRLWTSIALMPVSAPFALVPVIPNLPFFYLCFRAYSHFRAWYGSKLLDFLTTKNLIQITASSQLDEIYARGLLSSSEKVDKEKSSPTKEQIDQVARDIEAKSQDGMEEIMLSQNLDGRLLAEGFQLPGMEVEIERAVEQVQKSIKAQQEANGKKEESAAAAAAAAETKQKATAKAEDTPRS